MASEGLSLSEAQSNSQWQAALASIFRLLVVEGVENGIHKQALFRASKLPPAMSMEDSNHIQTIQMETIKTLCLMRFALQDNFTSAAASRAMHAEAKRLELEGALHIPYQQRMSGIRYDKLKWLCADDAAALKCPHLAAQMRRMEQIPYQLNRKKLERADTDTDTDTHESSHGGLLKASPVFMLSCYPDDGAMYRPHCDGGVGVLDNGRALTCLLYLNPDWQDAHGA
jgi:Rps23 Pro-64 3,4-dihydroxylase Tpa1-like proline 4-hydroxylase